MPRAFSKAIAGSPIDLRETNLNTWPSGNLYPAIVFLEPEQDSMARDVKRKTGAIGCDPEEEEEPGDSIRLSPDGTATLSANSPWCASRF